MRDRAFRRAMRAAKLARLKRISQETGHERVMRDALARDRAWRVEARFLSHQPLRGKLARDLRNTPAPENPRVCAEHARIRTRHYQPPTWARACNGLILEMAGVFQEMAWEMDELPIKKRGYEARAAQLMELYAR
jgi:hypothetical protein